MSRLATFGVAAAGIGLGAVTGYLAERAVLRPRLLAEAATAAAPLGSLVGELAEVRGPDGLRIVAESYGPPDAPQLVLAHGFTCTGRVWHEQVAGLADRYRLITYDQPGHGRSSAPRSARSGPERGSTRSGPERGSTPYSIALCGDTLAAVVRQVARPGPLVLAGHSMGGMAVLDAVLRYDALLAERVTGVVLCSTTSRANVPDVALEFGIGAAARLDGVLRRVVPWLQTHGAGAAAARGYRSSTDLSFLLARSLSTGRHADPRVVDFTEQLVLDSDPDMVLGSLSGLLSLDVDAALDHLTVPTTVVVGDEDRLTPRSLSRRMVERAPTAELVELAGVGHMAPLEAPAEVNAILAAHLAGTAGTVARAEAAARTDAGVG